MKVLVATSGPMSGDVYPVAGRTLIGRDGECDIQVADRHASRRHACVLELDDGSVLLRDLRSQNGTLLRGERVKEAQLTPGDELSIGGTSFALREMSESEVAAQEPPLRLITGPAMASTISGDRPAGRLGKAARAARAGLESNRRPGAASCCDSPLAERARAEDWLHCPACGTKLRD